MTSSDLPRWEIKYSPAGSDEVSLIIAADSMITALKQAQQLVRELFPNTVVYIRSVAEARKEEPV